MRIAVWIDEFSEEALKSPWCGCAIADICLSSGCSAGGIVGHAGLTEGVGADETDDA